jgi:D-alanine--poly(phosphoribitol) ligase subunit 2
MEKKLNDLFKEIILFDAEKQGKDLNLFEAGYLDSFGYIELINTLEEEFEIEFSLELIESGELNNYNKFLDYIKNESL